MLLHRKLKIEIPLKTQDASEMWPVPGNLLFYKKGANSAFYVFLHPHVGEWVIIV